MIIDTAGRLHVDEELMDELVNIARRRQAAQHPARRRRHDRPGRRQRRRAFKEHVDLDGVILTKLDGDARGGAALSVRAVTGKPIKFASTGEKLDDFDVFHPDRMASRILGMGDVLIAHREGRGVARREAGGGDGGEAPPRRVHPRGLPRPAQAGAQDGLALEHPRHAARRAGHEGAQERAGRRQAARPHRGDDLQP